MCEALGPGHANYAFPMGRFDEHAASCAFVVQTYVIA